MKEKSEALRPAFVFGDDDFRSRPVGKQSGAQFFLGCDARIAETFVRRQVLYKFENERNVGWFRAPNLNRIRQIPEPR